MTSDPSTIDFIDPEIATTLADLPPFVFDEETLPIIRTLMPGAQDAPADIDHVEYVVDGDVTVEMTAHRSRESSGTLPCIYWIHGGGLVIGNRHMDNNQLDRWCRELACACVTVEYRLAPENPYPAALDDCWAGLIWVAEHAADLGVDAGRIGLGGRSAGGGLAAAVTLRARERAGWQPSFLLLDQPMLDDRQRTPSSRLDGLPIWSRESNRFGWKSYLGEHLGSDDVPAFAAPARETDLRSLPPTCVVVAGLDGLRDESVEFASHLMQAGVPTDLYVYPGAPHGFQDLFADAQVSQRAKREVEEWVRRQFQRTAAS